ncbi:hypothetical protein GBP88_13750 [Mycobacterium avium subsp. hominissuis]|uniref:Uncharacterized protein n=1 Tax=Mycobacterium avium subsp. hominissuis TaxID=439334 RepID=A0A3B6XAX8_MYCAV|nr:hypothetical protein DFS55_18975 [Mycobacterium avium subsp. hominissuis]AYQ67129.1 hypothetical protein EC390_01930 [Mycobacterium avium subsp. paratuberculosis]AZB14824.1 hypothetical protein EGM64_16615 [Mycobacterium avium subsp. paratuberculosis]AZB38856.1 hypothetical protein EGM60_13530 [Mycobacterium avium subsp. paratuberculosis]AZP80646.1 hypothetical protein EGA31_06365 [Mycobacterium avium subsp. paratuberculosis]
MTSALVSSIHMTLSVWATIKESLSHDSENVGNLLPGRFAAVSAAKCAVSCLIAAYFSERTLTVEQV